MTHDQHVKASLRVGFTKAALHGVISAMEYINFVEPATIVAEKAWKIGDALAEMECKNRAELTAEHEARRAAKNKEESGASEDTET